MLTDHEFDVLIHRLKNGKQRKIDVDRLVLDAEELRYLLKRIKRMMKDQRDVFNDMGIFDHG